MRIFARYTLSIGAAAALLVGCGALPLDSAQGKLAQGDIRPPIGATHRLSSSYQQLFRFHHPYKDGQDPFAGLLDVNGTLYGTTASGGTGKGTVYSVTTSGREQVLYKFKGLAASEGASPESDLVNVDGTLYGTTSKGGGSVCSQGCGTVYSVSTSGAEKVLYAFKGGSDGAYPLAGLIDENGALYGTTSQGGRSACSMHVNGCGTVFSVTTSGKERVLHNFLTGSDGAYPLGDLIDVQGVLYGTTSGGGSAGGGAVFNVTRKGVERVIYSFKGDPDGTEPSAGLLNLNGTLYGTTYEGGAYNDGIVFSVTPSGAESVLHSFAPSNDGLFPEANLISLKGILYGTTSEGGIAPCDWEGFGCGTIYSVTTGGAETVLYRFAGASDGASPIAGLINVKGTLYGTTAAGGHHDTCCDHFGRGTVFKFSP